MPSIFAFNKFSSPGIDTWPIYSECDGRLEIDFQKIIPAPDIVLQNAFPARNESVIWYLTSHGRREIDDEIVDLMNRMFPCMKPKLTKDICRTILYSARSWVLSKDIAFDIDLYISGRKNVSCFLQTGYPDATSWRAAIWGTPANADHTIIQRDCIYFQTTLEAPSAIACALSKQHPKHILYHERNNTHHSWKDAWLDGVRLNDLTPACSTTDHQAPQTRDFSRE